MSAFLVYIFIVASPVIELDDLIVEGQVKRPQLIELRESRLQNKIESAANTSLRDLELRLIEPQLLEEEQLAERQVSK